MGTGVGTTSLRGAVSSSLLLSSAPELAATSVFSTAGVAEDVDVDLTVAVGFHRLATVSRLTATVAGTAGLLGAAFSLFLSSISYSSCCFCCCVGQRFWRYAYTNKNDTTKEIYPQGQVQGQGLARQEKRRRRNCTPQWCGVAEDVNVDLTISSSSSRRVVFVIVLGNGFGGTRTPTKTTRRKK
jgi:hypothetical protein